MGAPPTYPDSRRWMMLICLAILAGGAVFFALTSRTGDTSFHAWLATLHVLALSVPAALIWFAAAAGYGYLLRRPGTKQGFPLQCAVGIALLLLLETVAGRCGLLASTIEGWLLLLPGLLITAVSAGRLVFLRTRTPGSPGALSPHWMLMVLPLVTLFIAAASPPGWLWDSEFGGYDVLSYHLQLPEEWLTAGVVHGLEHNVYAFMPGYMETAFLHLRTLCDDPDRVAISCQLIHAACALLTALVVGEFAGRLGGRSASWCAAGLVLATPWVIVVGSMAYNEMMVCLMSAAALLLYEEADDGKFPFPAQLILGLLLGVAVGAKLTATGLVVLPITAWILTGAGPFRTHLKTLLTAGLCAACVLSPWLTSNLLLCGNPLFPFLADLLGSGHWTGEQVARWHAGHAGHAGISILLDAFFLERLGGDGWPQWGLLPVLAAAAVAIGSRHKDTRRMALRLGLFLLLQLIFWYAMTHGQARFLLPAIIPAASVVAVVSATFLHHRKGGYFAITGTVLVLSILPPLVLASQQGGAPAAMIGAQQPADGADYEKLLSDEELSPVAREGLLREYWLNHGLSQKARVLGIGESAPWRFRQGNLAYTTVWDRHPWSDALDSDNNILADLALEGYTHILVNEIMLRVWERAGWLPPGLRSEEVLDTLGNAVRDERAHLIFHAGGSSLYGLGPADSPTRPR